MLKTILIRISSIDIFSMKSIQFHHFCRIVDNISLGTARLIQFVRKQSFVLFSYTKSQTEYVYLKDKVVLRSYEDFFDTNEKTLRNKFVQNKLKGNKNSQSDCNKHTQRLLQKQK